MAESEWNETGTYENLYERLTAYSDTDYYPFHMPGHKRAEIPFINPYKIDITEIEGFDNLHHAQDVLLEAQKRLEGLYQSRKSYYLVNGSTCGILSAAGACAKRGDSVIIARNCHKAVYNAVKIFGLQADHVYPEFMQCGIQGQIRPQDIEKLLSERKNVRFVLVTSPSFDGIVSDIAQIARIVHAHHAYLIVDEAHGAHFTFSRYFPESAVSQGADIVIHSLHKTLPSFTQTAALHIAGDLADEHKVEEMLGMFQTSSPSYLFMAGIDLCMNLLEKSGQELFETYEQRLSWFYENCRELKSLHVLTSKDYEPYHVFDADKSKIVICTLRAEMNGKQLYECLLRKYHLQLEMYSERYVLAMTSIMDTQEGFERLLSALREIDEELNRNASQEQSMELTVLQRAYAAREKVLEISEAGYYNIEETPLEESSGRICGETVFLYPPGIPMIVPGEVISDDLVSVLEECRNMGLNIQGMKDKQKRKILTVAYRQENRI